MLITDLVVETLPGKAAGVAERMAQFPGMERSAARGDHQVIARWSVPDFDTLEGMAEALCALNPEIVAVSPTVVSGEP